METHKNDRELCHSRFREPPRENSSHHHLDWENTRRNISRENGQGPTDSTHANIKRQQVRRLIGSQVLFKSLAAFYAQCLLQFRLVGLVTGAKKADVQYRL